MNATKASAKAGVGANYCPTSSTGRHEASYRHNISSSNGIERGKCNCGATVKRLIGEGETPIQNRRQWVTEFVSLVRS